jgi:hypothetical protein
MHSEWLTWVEVPIDLSLQVPIIWAFRFLGASLADESKLKSRAIVDVPLDRPALLGDYPG